MVLKFLAQQFYCFSVLFQGILEILQRSHTYVHDDHHDSIA